MALAELRTLAAWSARSAAIAAALGILWSNAAVGQNGLPPLNIPSDSLLQRTDYLQESPPPEGLTDEAPPTPPPAETPPAAEEPPPAETPWTMTELFTNACGENWLKDHKISIYGNTAQSFAANFQTPGDGFNGPVTWTDQSNKYQVNQLWIGSEKLTDTSNRNTDWGYRVDMNFGTSSRLFTETGFEPHNYYGNEFYGLAFPNAYAEIAQGKLKVKIGRFVSPIGYFTVNTTQNFFNTIPYTYQWGEPFTHTGIWASYPVTDKFLVTGGIIRGWDNFDNHNPHAGFLGTWGYTWENQSNLTHVMIYSLEPNFNFAFTPRYYQSLVYTKPISEKLVYVGQSDLGVQQNATSSGKTAFWYGINQYLFYQINKQLTWGVNFEWWRDEEGYRVAGFLPSNLPSGITNTAQGFPTNRLGYAGNFYQITMGPKWFPTKSPNFYIRPNVRFDWFQGSILPGLNPAGLKPYDDGTKNYQTLFVTDFVLLF